MTSLARLERMALAGLFRDHARRIEMAAEHFAGDERRDLELLAVHAEECAQMIERVD